jgi:hypothetical protein
MTNTGSAIDNFFSFHYLCCMDIRRKSEDSISYLD